MASPVATLACAFRFFEQQWCGGLTATMRFSHAMKRMQKEK